MGYDNKITDFNLKPAFGQDSDKGYQNQIKQNTEQEISPQTRLHMSGNCGLLRLRRTLPARIKLILNLLAAFRASPHDSRRVIKAVRPKWQGFFRMDNEPASGNQNHRPPGDRSSRTRAGPEPGGMAFPLHTNCRKLPDNCPGCSGSWRGCGLASTRFLVNLPA